MMELVQSHALIILAALLAVSEALALIPGIKSHGIFQAIVNGLKTIYGWLVKQSKTPDQPKAE